MEASRGILVRSMRVSGSYDSQQYSFRLLIFMDFLTVLLLFFRCAVDINPTGRSYASGAEDGYVRLHLFDKDYLDMKDPVPEEDEAEEVPPTSQ